MSFNDALMIAGDEADDKDIKKFCHIANKKDIADIEDGYVWFKSVPIAVKVDVFAPREITNKDI